MLKIILSAKLLLFAIFYLSYFTGETTKNLISNFPAVTDEVLDPHESAAKILLYMVTSISVLTLFAFKFLNNKYFMRAFLLLLTVVSVYEVHVSVLGMKIRHTEIRNQQQNFNIDED